MTDNKCLTVFFIPAINLDDTKIFDVEETSLLMVYICSQVGNMCHTPHDRSEKKKILFKVTMIPIN
jgi:hypothetical protein